MKDEGGKSSGRTLTEPAFLNVDLEIESRVKLDPLVLAWGDRIHLLYHGPGRLGPGPAPAARWHLLALESARQHRTPDATIHALCALVETLPPAPRRLWDRANKRFDLGYSLRASQSWMHFALRSNTLARLNTLGAALAVSIYRADESSR